MSSPIEVKGIREENYLGLHDSLSNDRPLIRAKIDGKNLVLLRSIFTKQIFCVYKRMNNTYHI